ncbi:probable serine/threonine-protein kinase clkA [Vespa mandarinia]|uniref:probable serine/threonine-protein kinase clkA n=1 Tax=Vespa mandarinia TaxID=7446 RepID=UPI001619EF64|nr:probable serine/threonine-protein kinase clkA [Vespa mandarinia]
MIFVRNVLLLIIVRYCVCFYYEPGGISDSLLFGSNLEKDKLERVNFYKERYGNQDRSLYDKDLSTNHERNENAARYNEQDKERGGFNKDQHSSGHTEISNESDNSYHRHGTSYYKKGYHNIGFSNNYHKDESGNKTSFYEDSDDEKGHRAFDKNAASYENNLEDIFRDGTHDASFRERNKAEHGNYDNGQRYVDSRARYDQFQNNQRYDDERKYLHDDVGRYYDRNRDHFRDYGYQYYPYGYDDGYASSHFYQNYHVDTQPRRYPVDPYLLEYLRDHRYIPNYHNRRIYYPNEEYYDNTYRNRYYNINFNNRFGNRYLPYNGGRHYN